MCGVRGCVSLSEGLRGVVWHIRRNQRRNALASHSVLECNRWVVLNLFSGDGVHGHKHVKGDEQFQRLPTLSRSAGVSASQADVEIPNGLRRSFRSFQMHTLQPCRSQGEVLRMSVRFPLQAQVAKRNFEFERPESKL